jgi:hypothetical protein
MDWKCRRMDSGFAVRGKTLRKDALLGWSVLFRDGL